MSLSLRERWQKQLEAAQVDLSWQARVEERVLRFLLAHYEGREEAVPLAAFPLYECPLVREKARLLPSRRDQHERLERIAQVGREVEKAEMNPSIWRKIILDVPTRPISERAYKNMMDRRKKPDRGYY